MFNVINEPAVTLTEAAINKVREVIEAQGQEGAGLRIYIAGGGCSGFKYGMMLESQAAPNDEVFEFDGVKVIVDDMSLPYLRGASVDYVDDALLGQGFKIENPNAASTCGCGSSFRTADSAPAGGGCASGGCGSH